MVTRSYYTPIRLQATQWVIHTRAFIYRYVREMLRSKVGLFWSFAFPVIWYALTVYLNAIPGVPAAGQAVLKAILGISFGIFGAFTVTLVGFTGHLAADIDAKRYRKFRSLPIAPSTDLAGRFAAGGLLGIASWLLAVGVAFLDGAAYHITKPYAAFIVLLAVFLFCLIGMVTGLVLTLLVPQPEHATTTGTGLLVIGFFVTGYNGTVASVFPGTGWFLNVIPNSLATRITIYHLVDTAWGPAGLAPPAMPATPWHLGLLAIYAISLTGFGLVVMRRWVYGSDLGE